MSIVTKLVMPWLCCHLDELWNVIENFPLLLSGIPYADPPIGDLRFTLPQKIAPNGQKYYVGNNASNPFTDSICSQMDFHEVVTGQEDCLHLHVYVPETGKGQ